MTSKDRVLKHTAARSGARGVRKGRGSQAAAVTDALRERLAEHLGALRFVNGTLAVCAQALRQQNAEMDADIALVIQRTAGDKLDATIDQIEELVYGLELQEVA